MKLLTDGTSNNPILGFCVNIVAQYGESWPPTENVLARAFVDWLGLHSFLTREQMTKICEATGVNLTFVALPHEIRGFNCKLDKTREIVICETQTNPFALHTLFHEFREMLEHDFYELGHPIIGINDSLEIQAEQFAVLCRTEAAARELPAIFQMVENIQNKWLRYVSFGFVVVFGIAYVFQCIYTPQMEEMLSQNQRQRYVRM